MSTVQSWAENRGYQYVFIDDSIFDRVPRWYWVRVKGQINLVTDLARLLLAQDFLSNGYERSIWIDADVVICDPDEFSIEHCRGFAFCREIWLSCHKFRFSCLHNINNAVVVFEKGNQFLEGYIDDVLRIVKSRTNLHLATVSTFYLTGRYKKLRPFLLMDVGLVSPIVTKDIASRGGQIAAYFMLRFGHRVNAINLCASFLGRSYQGVTLHESDYTAAVNNLTHNKGDLLNRFAAPISNGDALRITIKARLSLLKRYSVARYNLRTMLKPT